MYILRIAIFLCMTLVMSFAFAEKNKSILVLGDSLSAGYGINPAEGWVNLMNEPLKKYGNWELINASVSGETSSGGNARLPALLTEHKPSIVIIELGANDALRGQPLKILQGNLQLMIDTSTKSGAKVLLIGMQIPTNYGPRYTREFSETYPKMAEKNKLPLVPFLLEGVATHPELFQKDGLHPKTEAQPTIVKNVWALLETMLVQTPKKKTIQQ